MRLLKNFIFASIFLSLAFIGVSAEKIGGGIREYPTGTRFVATELKLPVDTIDKPALFSVQPTDLPIDEYLTEQCMKHVNYIFLYNYNISVDEFGDIYFNFATKHPECLVHTSYICYTYSNDETHVAFIAPTYVYENYIKDENGDIMKDEYGFYLSDTEKNLEADTAARQLMEDAIAEYVELAEPFDDPLEKLLLIHDKMIEKYEYDPLIKDENGKDTATHGWVSHHAYGLFLNKTAVCQGYAQAFYMIASRLGIETDFCRSDSFEHIWNYAKINGKWYHVDVTWDDHSSAVAYHNNFMISDDTRKSIILASKYGTKADFNDWVTYLDTLPCCDDTTFESEYLFNISVPFTVSYDDDGYFNAHCKYQGNYTDGSTKTAESTFRSKSLHAGAIVTTKPVFDSDKKCYVYDSYPLAKYNSNLTPTIVDCKDGEYTFHKRVGTISLSLLCLDTPIYCDTSADYTDIFFWDIDTLMPFGEKIRIEH